MEQDKKERLLTAAIKLFSEYGYEQVSIRQLAQASGLNSAMVSYYFGGKEKLYDAALSRQAEAMADFISHDSSQLSPEEVLTRYAEVMEKIHREYPELGRFIVQAFTGSVPLFSEFGKRLEGLFKVLSGALQRGIEEGRFRQDLEVKEAIILLAGMVNFHFLSRDFRQRFPSAAGKDEKVYLQQALRIYLAGIARRD